VVGECGTAAIVIALVFCLVVLGDLAMWLVPHAAPLHTF
jgi:hypothetical protein